MTKINSLTSTSILKRGQSSFFGQVTTKPIPGTEHYSGAVQKFIDGQPVWSIAGDTNLPMVFSCDSSLGLREKFFIGSLIPNSRQAKKDAVEELGLVPLKNPAKEYGLNPLRANYTVDTTLVPSLVHLVKVGSTNDLPQRMGAHRSANILPINPVWNINPMGYTVRSVEKAIHSIFAHRAIRTKEQNEGVLCDTFNLNYFELWDLCSIKSTPELLRYLVAASKPEAVHIYNVLYQFATEGNTEVQTTRHITVSEDRQ